MVFLTTVHTFDTFQACKKLNAKKNKEQTPFLFQHGL